MVSILVELLFLVGIGVTFLAASSFIFFMQVFDNLFSEEIYKRAFAAFRVVLIAIILHGFYHLSGDFLGSDNMETVFEFASLGFFLAGMVMIGRITMKTRISFEAHKRLQQEVDRMTMELRNYVQELEGSNKIKDLFADIMSHDLLSPISIILNYTEMMKNEKGMSHEDYYEVVRRNALKGSEMIHDASYFSRIQGIDQITTTKEDLDRIIKTEIERIEPLAKEKYVTIHYVSDGIYPVQATSFTGQIFSNLLSNAIKFSPRDGPVKVEVEMHGRFWRTVVSDRGEGIPKKFRESIFNRFESSEKHGVKGTGLGLAIVKRLVELHKGRVWVEDNPGGGSSFVVELPKA